MATAKAPARVSSRARRKIRAAAEMLPQIPGGGGGGRQPRPRFLYHKTGEIANGVDGALEGVCEDLGGGGHGFGSGRTGRLCGVWLGAEFRGIQEDGFGEIWRGLGRSITNFPFPAKTDEKKFRPKNAPPPERRREQGGLAGRGLYPRPERSTPARLLRRCLDGGGTFRSELKTPTGHQGPTGANQFSPEGSPGGFSSAAASAARRMPRSMFTSDSSGSARKMKRRKRGKTGGPSGCFGNPIFRKAVRA